MTKKDYTSKPITRSAHKVEETDIIEKHCSEEATFILLTQNENVTFKAYEEVKTGDYIVYLNKDDIYHCSKKVFEERNIVDIPWGS